jgi:hypothetical protein
MEIGIVVAETVGYSLENLSYRRGVNRSFQGRQ